MIAQGSRAILPYKIYVVIPGRGVLAREPGIHNHRPELCGEHWGYGFRARASFDKCSGARPGMTEESLVVLPPTLRRRLAAREFFQAWIVSRRHAPHIAAQVFAPFSGAAGT